MRILTGLFCALSTSPSWQSWLYHFDQELHSSYVKKLRESSGCNANRDLMSTTLNEIDQKGGSEKLIEFLQQNYPQVIQDDTTAEQRKSDVESMNRHKVFLSFVPGILTYPKRVIFVGPKIELIKEVRQFTLDKPVHDSIIVDDRAYVEYLEQADMHLKDAIPMKNWQIAVYRNKNNI